MNASKLKALLITACCLVFALFAKGQAMDDAPDSQDITLWKKGHSEIYLKSSKPEPDNVGLRDTMLPLTQCEDENSIASWGPYVTSPIKAVINGTYSIVDFAVKRPTQATITTFLVAAQFTLIAADCNCLGWTSDEYCSSDQSMNFGTPASYGMFPNATSCQQFIGKFFRNSQPYVCYYGCN